MHTLRNRSINRMRWTVYELVESGVRVREKDINGVREVTIDYDRIGKESTYFLHHSGVAMLAFILFLLLAAATGTVYILHGDAERLAWVFWLAAAAFAFIYYQNTKREGFRLGSDFGSVVISGKRRDVEAFIATLSKKKEEAITQGIERRLAVMERAEVEKYLLALRAGSVLTQEQYETIRTKTGLEDDFKPRLGFQA